MKECGEWHHLCGPETQGRVAAQGAAGVVGQMPDLETDNRRKPGEYSETERQHVYAAGQQVRTVSTAESMADNTPDSKTFAVKATEFSAKLGGCLGPGGHPASVAMPIGAY